VLEIPIERAVRVPVVLRVGCAVRAPQGVPQCAVGDAPLQPLTILVLDTPAGKLPFQVDQVRGAQPLESVDVVVQFTARREVLARLRRGDADQGQYVNPLAAGAVVTAIGSAVSLGGDTERVDATLRADVQRTTAGWTYASAPLRAGSPFVLRTATYEVSGVVVRVSPEWTPPASGDQAASR
jgi:hypothetical protein